MSSDWNLSAARYAGIGLELAASVVVLALLGWWVDHHFGTAPWGVLTGALIGLVGGMYSMVRAALEATRSPETTKSPETETREDTDQRPGGP